MENMNILDEIKKIKKMTEQMTSKEDAIFDVLGIIIYNVFATKELIKPDAPEITKKLQRRSDLSNSAQKDLIKFAFDQARKINKKYDDNILKSEPEFFKVMTDFMLKKGWVDKENWKNILKQQKNLSFIL